MSVRHKRSTTERRHGVPAFEQIRETVRTGPAAAFDFGFTLPEMSMARIAALPEPEWARPSYVSRHGLPLSAQLCPVDMVRVAASRASVEDNVAVLRAVLSGPDADGIREQVALHVARLAAQLAPLAAQETAVSR